MSQDTSLRSFTGLLAWQKCREIRKAIAVLTKSWPADEKYRLVDQILRSSRAPCANIAEGYGRYHENDNARFCRMARGSLYETLDHLSAAFDAGLVDNDTLKEHWRRVEEAIRVLNGYVRYLKGIDAGSTASEPMPPYGNDEPIFADQLASSIPPDLTTAQDRPHA